MIYSDQSVVDWERIYAVPYHPLFKKRISAARTLLRLPQNGIRDEQQASTWLHKHLGIKSPYSASVQTIPLTMAAIQSLSDSMLWDTDIPLWLLSIEFLKQFKLPLRMRNYLGLYILTGNEEWYYLWNGLDVKIEPNGKAGEAQLAIIVDGVNSSTTKEQWLDVWNTWVIQFRPLTGKVPENKRFAPGKALRERTKRYNEWYELSQTKGPAKAFRDWISKHDEYGKDGKFSENALLKGAKHFKNLLNSKYLGFNDEGF